MREHLAGMRWHPAASGHQLERTGRMRKFIGRLVSAAERRARYARTRREIARLPLDVALDVDLYPRDAARIARAAVYGRD